MEKMLEAKYRMADGGDVYTKNEYDDKFNMDIWRKLARGSGIELPEFTDLEPVEVPNEDELPKFKERLKFLYKRPEEYIGYTAPGGTGYYGYTGAGTGWSSITTTNVGYTGYTGIAGYSGIQGSTGIYTGYTGTSTVSIGTCSTVTVPSTASTAFTTGTTITITQSTV